jgi:hypothetical protein
MIVQYDESTQRWRVVDHAGTVFEEFETCAQAWKWVDEHNEDDLRDAGHARSDQDEVTTMAVNVVVMSNDDLRAYVRQATWDALKDSYMLTAKR